MIPSEISSSESITVKSPQGDVSMQGAQGEKHGNAWALSWVPDCLASSKLLPTSVYLLENDGLVHPLCSQCSWDGRAARFSVKGRQSTGSDCPGSVPGALAVSCVTLGRLTSVPSFLSLEQDFSILELRISQFVTGDTLD